LLLSQVSAVELKVDLFEFSLCGWSNQEGGSKEKAQLCTGPSQPFEI